MEFSCTSPRVLLSLLFVMLKQGLGIKVKHLALLELVSGVGEAFDELKIGHERDAKVDRRSAHEIVVLKALRFVRRDIDNEANVVFADHGKRVNATGCLSGIIHLLARNSVLVEHISGGLRAVEVISELVELVGRVGYVVSEVILDTEEDVLLWHLEAG